MPDLQGLQEHPPGRRVVPERELGLPERNPGVRRTVHIADPDEDRQRRTELPDGLSVLLLRLAQLRDPAPDLRLPVRITQFGGEPEGGGQLPDRLGRFGAADPDGRDRAAGHRLAVDVAGVDERVQRGLEVPERRVRHAPLAVPGAQLDGAHPDAEPVADLVEQQVGAGPLLVRRIPVVAVQRDLAQVAQHDRLGPAVPAGPGAGQPDPVRLGPVVEPGPQIQVRPPGRGDPPGQVMQPVVRGRPHRRHHARPLGIAPLPRLGDRHPGPGAGRELGRGAVQHPEVLETQVVGGPADPVQRGGQHPGQVAHRLRPIGSIPRRHRVQPDQFVHPVPRLPPGHRAHIDQVRLDQPVQAAPDRRAGRRTGSDRVQRAGGELAEREVADQPVEPRLLGAERPVAEVGTGADRQLADAQLVQPLALVPQPAGQLGRAQVRPLGQPAGRDPDRQRQVAAGRDDLVGGGPVLVTVQRPVAGHPAEQLDRLGGVQQVEAETVRAGQVGEPGPAGDHQRGRTGARQQRQHLAGRADVVHDHQHPAAGQFRPQRGGPALGIGRHRGVRNVQTAQQVVQGSTRVARLGGTAHVQVDLPVRERVPDLVPEPHRERGLAGAGRAGDHRYRRPDRIVAADQLGQPLQLGGPAAEVRYVERQLARDLRPDRLGRGLPQRSRPGRPAGGPLFGSDAGQGQLRARLDSQFVGQGAERLVVGRPGVGGVARLEQRVDEPAPQPFVVRVLGEPVVQQHDGAGRVTVREPQVEQRVDQAAVLRLQPADRALPGRGQRQVLQRPAAPQVVRPGIDPGCLLGVPRVTQVTGLG